MKWCLVIVEMMLLVLSTAVSADDLYKVAIHSEYDAARLKTSGAEPVLVLNNGYLILANQNAAAFLETGDISMEYIAAGLTIDQLVIDRGMPSDLPCQLPVLYDAGGLRLCLAGPSVLRSPESVGRIIPIRKGSIAVTWHPARTLFENIAYGGIDLDSLIDRFDTDSIRNSVGRLAAYGAREAGTDSCRAAGDWILNAFRSYGYDSAYVDSHLYITNPDLYIYDTTVVRNIVACKIGSRFPERQIVIGAHYDAAPGCPGADDNASGTAGILEIARIFKDLETEMTVVFIAFDAEELILVGSQRYAADARIRGDDIIHMFNLDMIGHLTNDTLANLYVGSDSAYAQLWNRLADSLVNITGTIISSAGLSDEYLFRARGYPAMFIQEYDFSTVYHCRGGTTDDTTFINFDYLTRMVQATAATAFTVTQLLPPIVITALRDVGDGQSLDISWRRGDPSQVDHYQLFYVDSLSAQPESLLIPKDSLHYVLSGLTDGMEYTLYMVPYDDAGQSSIAVEKVTGVPHSLPRPPQHLTAWPIYHGVRLSWEAAGTELDFSHYVICRDGIILPDSIADSVYIDDDPGLGSDMHQYRVRAVDRDGNLSDTTDIASVVMKAATLQPGRILAVNRSSWRANAMVDEAVTGAFLREALDGSGYDYRSDTLLADSTRVRLTDMVDYAVLVIGSESGRKNDFGAMTPDVAYFLSLGGKAVVFQRTGDMPYPFPFADTNCFFGNDYNDIYCRTVFDMNCRVWPYTMLVPADTGYLGISDFVGAHSLAEGYPDLVWDSLATLHHTDSPYVGVSGIPSPCFVLLAGMPVDTLYTYDSSTDSIFTEGQVIGWRSLDGPYQYVMLQFPLTFMERAAATAALRQAVSDLGIVVSADDNSAETPVPAVYELRQNYPNPFNPATTIEFYNPQARPTKATVTVFNILGQRIRTVYDDLAQPGLTRAVWDGRDESGAAVASGVYLYRLRIDATMLTRKMILLR